MSTERQEPSFGDEPSAADGPMLIHTQDIQPLTGSFPSAVPPVVVKQSPLPWALFLVTAVLGGGAVFNLQDQRGNVDKALKGKLEELKTATAAAQKSETEVGQLKTELENLKTENQSLLKQVAESDATKTQLAAEVERVTRWQASLTETMKTEMDAGDVKLTQDGSRLTVELADKALFESGDATISPHGAEVLAKVGAVLTTMNDRLVTVMGHTDDAPPPAKIKPQFPTNWELSTTRANNVARFLQEKANVPGKRLVASGHSQFQPLLSNGNPKGRARNRRIEIVLTPLAAGETKKK